MNGRTSRMLRQMRATRKQKRQFRSLNAATRTVISKAFHDYCKAMQTAADETSRMEWLKPSLPRTLELAGFY